MLSQTHELQNHGMIKLPADLALLTSRAGSSQLGRIDSSKCAAISGQERSVTSSSSIWSDARPPTIEVWAYEETIGLASSNSLLQRKHCRSQGSQSFGIEFQSSRSGGSSEGKLEGKAIP